MRRRKEHNNKIIIETGIGKELSYSILILFSYSKLKYSNLIRNKVKIKIIKFKSIIILI